MAAINSVLTILLLCCARIRLISSVTDPNDAAALRSLKDQWQNTPPSWGESDDPCGLPWEAASFGKLSMLYWLDLADNQLTGSIPVSTSTTPGNTMRGRISRGSSKHEPSGKGARKYPTD